MHERLEQQMEFLREIDKLKMIGRQTYLSDGVRKENDAEHSWHLALMACLLEEYVSDPVDVARVTTMVLIHDLVEIDAAIPTRMTRRGRKQRRSGKKRRRSGFLDCFPRNKESILQNCGRNSRNTKPRTQSTHTYWTISNRFC